MDSNKFMETLQEETAALQAEPKKLSAKEFFETNEGRIVIKLLAKDLVLKDNGFEVTNRAIKNLVANPLYHRKFYKDMEELGFSCEHLPPVIDNDKAPVAIFKLIKSN